MTSIPEFGITRENEERRDGGCGIVYDPATGKFAVGCDEGSGLFRLFSGGVAENEDLHEGILREVREESGLHDFGHIEQIAEAMTHYRNVLKQLNRVGKATCLLIILNSADVQDAHLEAHETFSLAWATADEIRANWEERNGNKDHDHWFYFFDKAEARLQELGHLA